MLTKAGVDETNKQVVRFSGAHRYFAEVPKQAILHRLMVPWRTYMPDVREVALYAEAVMHVCTLTARASS